MLGASIKSAAIITVAALACGSYLSGTISSEKALARRSIATASEPDRRVMVATGQDVQRPSALASGFGKVELRADAGGQYHAMVEIEGRRIPMLIDTGATYLSLTYDDALRAGLAPAPADYTVDVATANGVIRAARVMVRNVRLDTLAVTDVQALVLPREVRGTSLLGMSFLRRLGGFEVASGNLVMRP